MSHIQLTEVSKRASGPLGRRVAVLDASHLQELLWDRGRHDASSTRSGDEPHPDGAALASHFGGHGVWLSKLVAPETPPHRHNGELSQNDGASEYTNDRISQLYI